MQEVMSSVHRGRGNKKKKVGQKGFGNFRGQNSRGNGQRGAGGRGGAGDQGMA